MATVEVRSALKGQYHAALAMLRQAIERCPEGVWLSGEHPRSVWRIAYHALFYAHFYLQSDAESFRSWDGHRDEAQFLEATPWPPNSPPKTVAPYTQQELLEYWRICDGMIDEGVDRLDLEAAACGFPWYDMPKLDHQMMNVRHIQQHAGQLAEICIQAGVDVDWIGKA